MKIYMVWVKRQGGGFGGREGKGITHQLRLDPIFPSATTIANIMRANILLRLDPIFPSATTISKKPVIILRLRLDPIFPSATTPNLDFAIPLAVAA